MGRRLYVGNLPYSTSEDQLTELFSRAGKVDNVRVMRDMATGRARGFAFVEMSSDDEAQKAITELHEHQLDGRALVVNEARPKPEGGFGGAAEAEVVAGADLVAREVAAIAAVAAGQVTVTTSAAAAGKNLAGDRYGKRAAPRQSRGGPFHVHAVTAYSSTIQPSRSWMIRLP